MKESFTIINNYEEILSFHSLLQELQPELTLEEFKSSLRIMLPMGYKIIVMKLGEEIVGLTGIWVGAKLYCGKYIEIDNLVITEEYRSKRIGKKICDFVFEVGKKEKCKVVMLDAYMVNTRSHQFYEREGFEKKGFHFIKKI